MLYIALLESILKVSETGIPSCRLGMHRKINPIEGVIHMTRIAGKNWYIGVSWEIKWQVLRCPWTISSTLAIVDFQFNLVNPAVHRPNPIRPDPVILAVYGWKKTEFV